MILVYSLNGATPIIAQGHFAVALFRALRAALWLRGDKRDPQTGDTVEGVTLL